MGELGDHASSRASPFPYRLLRQRPSRRCRRRVYPDCWATIGALAAVPQGLRFSVGVYVLPMRNVFEVARATGTLAL